MAEIRATLELFKTAKLIDFVYMKRHEYDANKDDGYYICFFDIIRL